MTSRPKMKSQVNLPTPSVLIDCTHFVVPLMEKSVGPKYLQPSEHYQSFKASTFWAEKQNQNPGLQADLTNLEYFFEYSKRFEK